MQSTLPAVSSTRRGFLASALAGALASPALAADPSSATPLRVCVLADLHYMPGQWPNCRDRSFAEAIIARAQQAKCDLIVQLGDLMHGVTKPDERALLKLFDDSRIPVIHCLGNHDQDLNAWELTRDAYRLSSEGTLCRDVGDFRFIVLDPNYFCNEPGQFIHHSNGNYFKRNKGSTINWVPPAQFAWLRDVVLSSTRPCVILSHQTLERCNGGVTNRHEIRDFFREVNTKRPGHVRLVMNGHLHTDHLSVAEGTVWWDVNSANFQYYDTPHGGYTAAVSASARNCAKTIAWDRPLSAILSLFPDGRIRIEGATANYLEGVSPALVGLNAYPSDDRLTHPSILSAEVRV